MNSHHHLLQTKHESFNDNWYRFHKKTHQQRHLFKKALLMCTLRNVRAFLTCNLIINDSSKNCQSIYSLIEHPPSISTHSVYGKLKM